MNYNNCYKYLPKDTIIHEIAMCYLQKQAYENISPSELTQKYITAIIEIKETFKLYNKH